MNRRELIALVGGTAVSWPLGARAQQRRMHRIGALILGNADAESFRTEMREGLRKAGYVEGPDLIFDFRSAEGRIDLLPKIAAELVALKVDVIVAIYTPCGLAAHQATREIPIVVVSGDPVGSGLVESLANPGGNVTGVSLMSGELHGKIVELFHDMLPSVRRVAALGNDADPFRKPFLENVLHAGRSVGIEIAPATMVRGFDQIDTAFADMKQQGAGAVVVQGSLATKNVAQLALRHRLPAASISRSFTEIGGLMSYGHNEPDSFRRAAFFVVKVLQGGKPADMPVEQPTKFELVVNLKSGKTIGLTIPEAFLARADEVIE